MGLFKVQFSSRPGVDKQSWQGVCTDGDKFWTIQTEIGPQVNLISRWNSDWSADDSADVNDDLPSGATQITSVVIKNGILYTGANNFNTTPAKGWILEFNPTTFALIATHETMAGFCEGGAWRNNEFWAVFHNVSTVQRFDSDFTSIDTYNLSYAKDTSTINYQGAQWNGDHFLCNIHNQQGSSF